MQAAIVLLDQLAIFQESLMGWLERIESIRACILIAPFNIDNEQFDKSFESLPVTQAVSFWQFLLYCPEKLGKAGITGFRNDKISFTDKIVEELGANLQHYTLLVVLQVEGVNLPGRNEENAARDNGVLAEIDEVGATPLLKPNYFVEPVQMHCIGFHPLHFLKKFRHMIEFKSHS